MLMVSCALGLSAQEATVVPADEIPSSLRDATAITLTGEWGAAEFLSLKSALGTSGFIATPNTTLVRLDMSGATITDGTSLLINSGLSTSGVFSSCQALEEVVMPSAEEAVHFTSFEKAFMNCTALRTIDLSGLTNVTTFSNAFYGCAALQEADLSGNTAAVTSGAWSSAFEDCQALTSVVLPAGFVPASKVFSGCTSLTLIDWTRCQATEVPEFWSDMLDGVELSGVTLKLDHAQYELFAADDSWSQLHLEDLNPAPSTEYTVDAADIPSSLRDATAITLTGEWGAAEFLSLKSALGTSGFIATPNTTLVRLDMSGATITDGTSLLINSGLSTSGVFSSCQALEEVVMPSAEEAVHFTSFEKAFMNCTALRTIDLSGLTNVTTFSNAFYGCAALQEADLSGNTAAVTSGAWSSAFEDCQALTSVVLPAGFVPASKVFSGCTSLTLIDWTRCQATEVPEFWSDMLDGVELSGVTLKLDHAQYELFAADDSWSQLHLEDLNPAPSTEYTVDAADIPSSLRDATAITLTGEWDSNAFNSLCLALVEAPAMGATPNEVLRKIDMSLAQISEGTSLCNNAWMAYGIFRNCQALEEVVMPVAAEAAHFTDFTMAFQNCTALKTIDLSGCAGLTSIEKAFQGCTSLERVDLSACTQLQSVDDAFESCEALASVVLPAQFPMGKNTFAYCSALTSIDWTAFEGTEVPEMSKTFFMGIDDLKAITLSLKYEAWKLFSADSDWSELTLYNTEPEKVTDFVVDASEATGHLSSLRRAVTLTLTGEWDSDALNFLSVALGNQANIGATQNTTLQVLDMSQITVADNTPLWRSGLKEYGIFNNCTALREVILPAAEEAAKFTRLSKAFEGCTSLETIDLSLFTGATDIDAAFKGTAIRKADLSGCTSLGNTVSAFEGCSQLEEVILPAGFVPDNYTFADCVSLKTVDFTSYKDATEAPACKGNTFSGIDDLSLVTLLVDADMHELFENDKNWSEFNIVWDGKPDAVNGIRASVSDGPVVVYTVDGRRVGTFAPGADWMRRLPAGLYVVNGHKVMVRR